MVMSRWMALAVALGVIPLAIFQRPSLIYWWLGLWAALWVIDVLAAPRLGGLELTRTIVGTARQGQGVQCRLTVVNRSRRRIRGQLRDAWPPSVQVQPDTHPVDIAPESRSRFTTVLTPSRRGDTRGAKVTLRVWGPLHLGARQLSFDVPQSIRVLPDFTARKHLPSRLQRLQEMQGNAPLLQRGQGSEFDSLREYVLGDDVRDIDWRASARFEYPVVKTWRPERDRTVMLCLDMSRMTAARVGEAPRFDTYIQSVLLLGALAASAGDRVQLLAFDTRVKPLVVGSYQPEMLSALATAMAPLEPTLTEANWSGLGRELLRRLGHRSLVVLCTGVESSVLDSSLLETISALVGRHQVLIAAVRDPAVDQLESDRSSTAAIFRAGAAAAANLEREAAIELLTSRGARVIDTLPEQMPPALADAYLELKRMGRI